MYAIIETGGKQYWVVPGETLRIEKIEAQPGQEVTFPALWAAADASEGKEPETSRGGKVTAEVLKQDRGAKILVFKRRQKKAYKRLKGHRQYLTDIRVKSISLN